MSVKRIFHVSDVHIRNYMRLGEYAEQLTKLVDKIREMAEGFAREELRIVIAGDLIHQKNTISPELMSFTSTFIRSLESICKVILIAGNHDLVLNNTSRKDAITSLFETAQFNDAYFLDMQLGYHSGCVTDDNITWAVYSIYDNYMIPQFIKGDKNTIVGLYHGQIVGASLDNHTVLDSGVSSNIFSGCDFVIAGDIHKRQCITSNNVDIVYSGSLLQQNFGETVSNHGFCMWDVQSKKHTFIDLPSSYGLYELEIASSDDILNDSERLKNK